MFELMSHRMVQLQIEDPVRALRFKAELINYQLSNPIAIWYRQPWVGKLSLLITLSMSVLLILLTEDAPIFTLEYINKKEKFSIKNSQCDCPCRLVIPAIVTRSIYAIIMLSATLCYSLCTGLDSLRANASY
jgi:hypothetical protein